MRLKITITSQSGPIDSCRCARLVNNVWTGKKTFLCWKKMLTWCLHNHWWLYSHLHWSCSYPLENRLMAAQTVWDLPGPRDEALEVSWYWPVQYITNPGDGDHGISSREAISGWWLTYPSEKRWTSSVGMTIPNIWKNKKCSKPPTRYGLLKESSLQRKYRWQFHIPSPDIHPQKKIPICNGYLDVHPTL